MSVEIGPYSKFPSKLFGSGIAATLGASTSIVFLALCEHANRNNSNVFKASDRALASDTGLGTRTICEARKKLIEHDLIYCSRESGQSYKYTLKTQSLKWKPLKERPRQKGKPRALHVARVVFV
jgi:hypothetical protein